MVPFPEQLARRHLRHPQRSHHNHPPPFLHTCSPKCLFHVVVPLRTHPMPRVPQEATLRRLALVALLPQGQVVDMEHLPQTKFLALVLRPMPPTHPHNRLMLQGYLMPNHLRIRSCRICRSQHLLPHPLPHSCLMLLLGCQRTRRCVSRFAIPMTSCR